MTADVTGPARDELELPTPVRHLLDIGRAQLAELRAAEAAERERQAEANRVRFNAMFGPVRAFVGALIPDTLLQYVDWREGEAATRDPFNAHEVTLKVPGCGPVKVPLAINERGEWVIYRGYFLDGLREPVPTIAVAVALAREAYLERQADEESVPF
jgi:hypothetical protein